MIAAALPPRIIEKCLASDRVVIDTVVEMEVCSRSVLYSRLPAQFLSLSCPT